MESVKQKKQPKGRKEEGRKKESGRTKKEKKEIDGRRAEDRDCFTACSCLCHCDVPSNALKHGHSILSCTNDGREW